MKRKFVFAALLLAVVLAGCATFPTPSSGEDSLAVFSLSNDILEGKSTFGYYYLVLNDQMTGEEVRKLRLKATQDYVVVSNLNPGRYYVSSFYFQSEHGQPGSKKAYDNDFCPFTLRPETLTIVSKTFGTRLAKKEGGDLFMQFMAPKDCNYEETLAKLENDHPEEISSWKILY